MNLRSVWRQKCHGACTDFVLQHSSFSPAQLVKSLSSVDEDNFNKLKAAYDACMDEDTIKKAGIKPLQEILHHVADMFPVEESAFGKRTRLEKKDEEGLADTVLYLQRIGVSSLVSAGAGADDKDPDVVVVQVAPPYRVGLPAKDYYSDEAVIKKYEDMVAQVFENLHPSHKRENATLHAEWMNTRGHNSFAARGKSEDFAHDVVEFEKKLAAASPDAEDRDDVTVSDFWASSVLLLITSRNTTTPCLSRRRTSSHPKFTLHL